VQHESLMRMNFYVRSSQDAAAIAAGKVPDAGPVLDYS